MSIYHQLFNLLIFTLTGIVIGILFDAFRVIRKTFKTPDFITYIEDIIFWILIGGILLFTIFTFNDGEIRIYIFVGLLSGFIVYLLTFSKYFIKISVTVLCFIKKVIYLPLNIVYNFIKNFIYQPIVNILRKIRVNTTRLTKKQSKETINTDFPNICNKIDKY